MSSRSRIVRYFFVVLGACSCWGVAATAAVAAASKPIAGVLSKPGYTVLALAGNGKATSVRARTGSFTIRPPADRVTLQLRAPDGVYAGPIVTATEQHGKRAILGVRAGAKLGRIDVNVRRGYAKLRGTLRSRWIDRVRWARAKQGVPIGAGNFGRVRSKPSPGTVSGDLDLDGVPDLLDIDLNGNLILNKFDRSRTARAAVVTDQFLMQSNLTLTLDQTVNADAAGMTVQQADAALARSGRLAMGILPGESPELDCGQPQSRTSPLLGGLIYCTKGGTGLFAKPGVPVYSPQPFPDAFDPDGDGFGTMTPSSPQPAPGSGQLVMDLVHGATSTQIGTGDLLIQRVTRSGVELQFPATIQYIFDTVPTLVSYSDGRGNSATVHYPVKGPDPGPGAPGTRGNGFPVTARPNGNVVVTLAFWRPQRKPIPPETGEWIDIGRLNYSVGAEEMGAGGCPQDAYSTSDPSLAPLTTADVSPASYFGLKDLAGDQPANPAHTFTYTLDLTRCLAANGVTFNLGETRMFTFNAMAPNGTDSAVQEIAFTRQ